MWTKPDIYSETIIFVKYFINIHLLLQFFGSIIAMKFLNIYLSASFSRLQVSKCNFWRPVCLCTCNFLIPFFVHISSLTMLLLLIIESRYENCFSLSKLSSSLIFLHLHVHTVYRTIRIRNLILACH